MDNLLDWLAASEVAGFLRRSRWIYAAVNTAHVLGLALLVGAIVPMDLKLMGWWRDVAHESLVAVLAPCAALGLITAVATGLLLFSTRAPEYAGNPAFLAKLGFVGAGVVSALLHHAHYGRTLATASPSVLFRAGAISMLCWISALVSGRLIAFTGD